MLQCLKMLMNEIDLILEYQRSHRTEEANKIYQDNLQLVTKIAQGKDFCCRQNHREDLIQHGMIGLFRAVEKFDKERAHGWKTYKSLWIRKEMQIFVSKFCDFSVGDTIPLEDCMVQECEPSPSFLAGEISEMLSKKESQTLLSLMGSDIQIKSRDKRNLRKKIKHCLAN